MLHSGGHLHLGIMPGPEFLHFIRQAARSSEVGAISTQFESELRAGDDNVHALALTACGKSVGAVSFALLPLRFQPGAWSGRIDVVATAPEARGHGVAGLLLAGALLDFASRLGDRWRHVSVVAVHPAIERLARAYELQRIEGGETPLFFRDLDTPARAESIRLRASRELSRIRTDLDRECARCQRFVAADSWCAPGGGGDS